MAAVLWPPCYGRHSTDFPDEGSMLHVLGAGVVGIITAHFLAEDGHEVAILDERSGAAEGCSFGNAGLLAVGHAAPWAGPGAPVQMVRALLGLDPALKIGGLPSLSLMRWGAEFLGACNASSHRDNAGRLARLTRYSRDLTREIGERLAIDYAAQHEGTFYIFKDRRAFEVHRRLFAETGSDGGDYQPISRDEIVAREPALGRLAGEIAGGFFSSVDSSGNCRVFTRSLADRLVRDRGVGYHTETRVTGLEVTGGRVTAIVADSERHPTEGVVVALGTGTPALLATLGIRVSIVPVRGYSASFPIRDAAGVPRLSAIDEGDLVAFSRLGDILRVTAVAEFASRVREVPPARAEMLKAYGRKAFGEAIDVDGATFWTGERPATPAGPPFLGAVRGIDNLFVNAGHGTLGWTMACGSGRALADIVAGRAPGLGFPFLQ